MSKKITYGEAFNLASKLNTPEMLGIKDTEFGLAIYKNLTSIIEVYNTLQEKFKPSKEWMKLTEGVTNEEEINKLKSKKENKKLFETREKLELEYNKILNSNYSKLIVKVKLTNLKTRLSAQDIMDLKSMLIV